MAFRIVLLTALSLGCVFGQDITTIAGTGNAAFSGDGGAATAAAFSLPVFVATDLGGNIYVADQNNNRIRKIDLSGTVTTVAGNGTAAFAGDGGPALDAALNAPTGVFIAPSGDMYIADVGNQRIRVVHNDVINTVAGNGGKGYGGDGGAATAATFYNCVRAVVDSAGNIYIADQSNHRVRKVSTNGTIATIAGTGSEGFSGDSGPATSASLDNPTAIALDHAGNLYICDQFNHRIRKVDKNGIITTIAGTGVAGFGGDGGPATSATLNYPGGMIIDTTGVIFFSDDVNFRVRKIATDGTISTVAGNGTQSFSGDGGLATSASLNGQFGLAITPAGGLVIADSANNRVRLVSNASDVAPVFSIASLTNAASFQTGGSAGALATLFGQHLSVNLNGVATATTTPLKTILAGTTITVNGVAAPIVAVVNVSGTEQINFQLPWELAGQSMANVVVNNGVSSNVAVSTPITDAQPGVFVIDGAGDGAIEHANGSIVNSANPAAPGETIVIFGTGLGAVSPAQVTGSPASLTTLVNTSTMPTVTIAGENVEVRFSGLAPGFVGLNQVNITVPADAPSGSQNLIVTSNGQVAATVKVAIQ